MGPYDRDGNRLTRTNTVANSYHLNFMPRDMRLTKSNIAAMILLTGSMLGERAKLLPRPSKAADREPPASQDKPAPRSQWREGIEEQRLSGLVGILMPKTGGHCPLAFSPDGKILATGGGYDQIRLWNPFGGEQKALLKIKRTVTPQVDALALSPDGKFLAAGYASHDDKIAVRLWEIDTEKVGREKRPNRHYAGC